MIDNDGVSYFSVSMARPSVEPRVAEIYSNLICMPPPDRGSASQKYGEFIYALVGLAAKSFIATHWLDSLMATAWPMC